jgi:hypothetical protein
MINELVFTQIDPVIQIDGDSLMVSDSMDSYQWFECADSLIPINGAKEAVFIPSENGAYAVEVGLNECLERSACVEYISTSTIDHKQKLSLTIFPNPGRGQITIDCGYKSVSSGKLSVFSMNGKLVKETSINLKEGKSTFELSDLEAGMYIFRFISESMQSTVRYILSGN